MREAGSVALLTALLALAAGFDERHDDATRDDGRRDGGPLGWLAGSLRDRVLDVVGPDEIVERVDINAVLDRVDIDDLLTRVDIDGLLARADINALLDRADINALLGRVDVDLLLARVDINALLDRVDVNGLLARVDTDALLARTDVNAVLAQVEPDVLLARVDPDPLLDRVDINALLDRVDVDRVMDRVDVTAVVDRAGIPDIVAESTGSLAESLLDLLRRQLLGLDVVVMRAVVRILGRDVHSLPAGPAALAGDGGPGYSMPDPNATVHDVTGHYAGPVTRLAAYLLDSVIAGGAFTFTSGALGSLLRSVNLPVDRLTAGGALFGVGLVLWLFTYWWASTAIAGRTPGMALIGLRIVSRDGAPISGRAAFVRVVVMPVSIGLFGIGLVSILLDQERRALHDAAASSTVVYDWGDRVASLPSPLAQWLERHAAPVDVEATRAGARRGR